MTNYLKGNSRKGAKFAKTAGPKLAPLKTRIYAKGVTKQDPSAYDSFGFGDTGLAETPSLLGMSRKK